MRDCFDCALHLLMYRPFPRCSTGSSLADSLTLSSLAPTCSANMAHKQRGHYECLNCRIPGSLMIVNDVTFLSRTLRWSVDHAVSVHCNRLCRRRYRRSHCARSRLSSDACVQSTVGSGRHSAAGRREGQAGRASAALEGTPDGGRSDDRPEGDECCVRRGWSAAGTVRRSPPAC